MTQATPVEFIPHLNLEDSKKRVGKFITDYKDSRIGELTANYHDVGELIEQLRKKITKEYRSKYSNSKDFADFIIGEMLLCSKLHDIAGQPVGFRSGSDHFKQVIKNTALTPIFDQLTDELFQYYKSSKPANREVAQMVADYCLLGNDKKKLELVVDLCFVSAKEGYAPACFAIGSYCDDVKQNPQEALKYFRNAADQGHLEACYKVGYNSSGEESLKYLIKAAENGHLQAQLHLAREYEKHKDEKNLQSSIKYYLLAADQGNAEAQFKTAYYYQYGPEKNLNKAIEYYDLAAKQNHPAALYSLGDCYEEALNDQEAIKCYKLAATKGDANAQYRLAVYYEYGKGGVEQDFSEAIRLYKLAADQNITQAQYNLGSFYENGIGFEKKDLKEATQYYLKAADSGHAAAQYKIASFSEVKRDMQSAIHYYDLALKQGHAGAMRAKGFLCHGGVIDGTGKVLLKQDLQEAFNLYKSAADGGDAEAYYFLGVCYENGDGVKKNLGLAVKNYEKAADKEIASAQCRLATFYEKGIKLLLKQDKEKAFGLYEQAANQNNSEANFHLGRCYEKGIGVTEDLKKAVEPYKKAALHGNIAAQCKLGILYETGIGVEEPDPQKAFKLYEEATNKGNIEARYHCARCFEEGIGTNVDKKEAVRLYHLNADYHNHAAAQYRLGLFYLEQKNTTLGISYIAKAANKGIKGARQMIQSDKLDVNKDAYNAPLNKEEILGIITAMKDAEKVGENSFKVAQRIALASKEKLSSSDIVEIDNQISEIKNLATNPAAMSELSDDENPNVRVRVKSKALHLYHPKPTAPEKY